MMGIFSGETARNGHFQGKESKKRAARGGGSRPFSAKAAAMKSP
jgi:hypothetical protein